MQNYDGLTFERWTILNRIPACSRDVIAKCSCGSIKQVKRHSITSGRSHSCGCLRRELATRGEHRERLGVIFRHMKGRCYEPRDPSFKNYGARGISVCAEWLNDFDAFERWSLSNGYAAGLSIDRIDNNKSYSPANCRWSTSIAQRQHTRRVKMSPAKLALILVLHEAGMSNRSTARKLWVAHSCVNNIVTGVRLR